MQVIAIWFFEKIHSIINPSSLKLTQIKFACSILIFSWMLQIQFSLFFQVCWCNYRSSTRKPKLINLFHNGKPCGESKILLPYLKKHEKIWICIFHKITTKWYAIFVYISNFELKPNFCLWKINQDKIAKNNFQRLPA